MILNEYNQIIREFFDISDTGTRKCIIALEDAQQSQLLMALSSALYDKIVEKVDKIDFGTIPQSRGDITKVDGFENTVECLNIIRKMVVEYKEDTAIVDTVLTAIENVKNYKAIFMKAYSLGVELPMVIYNLIVMAIEQSVSLLISTTIQYVKDPSSQTMEAAFDKVAYNNAKDNMLYEQLVSFNKSCASGDLEIILRDTMKNGGKVAECGEPQEITGIDQPGSGVNTININVGPGRAGADIKAKKTLVCPQCGHNFEEDEDHQCPSPFEDDVEPEDAESTEEAPIEQDADIPNDECDVPCAGSDVPEKEEPECDPTPTMPINGTCDSNKEEPVHEVIGTIGATIAGLYSASPVLASLGLAAAAGGAVLGFKAIKFLLTCLIPMLRSITYFFVNTRVSISESLNVQAQFIEMNAYKLQYSTSSELPDDKRNKVVGKQLKIADSLKKFANFISIDRKKAEKEAKALAKAEAKKMKIDDLRGNVPTEIYDKSVLF